MQKIYLSIKVGERNRQTQLKSTCLKLWNLIKGLQEIGECLLNKQTNEETAN